jgi:type IV secretion system protein VirB6
MLIVLQQQACAITDAPNCRSRPSIKNIDQHCNNSCSDISSNSYFSYIIVKHNSVNGYGAVDSAFNMISAERTRNISTFQGIPNYFINSIDLTTLNYHSVYLTDNVGNVCETGTAGNCLVTPPETLDGCLYPTPNVLFNYGDLINRSLKPGDDPVNINGTTFRAINDDKMICIEAYFMDSGWIPMGCKQYYSPSANSIKPVNSICPETEGPCAVNGGIRHSKGFFPVCSLIMECMTDSIEKVFITGCGSTNPITLLSSFQNAMQSTVMAALILYVITFGIKIVLGNQDPSSGEVVMFLFKMILVVYFSVGFGTASKPVNPKDTLKDFTLKNSTNGVQDLIIPFFNALSTSLMNLQASGAGSAVCLKESSLCYFNTNDYDDDYKYLAVWDALDCRMAYYFGFLAAQGGGQASGAEAATAVVIVVAFYVSALASVFFFLLLSGQIVLFLLLVFYAIFLTAIIAYVLKVVVVCMIGGAITAYFSPIFVPMCLFNVTRGFFDGWIKLLFSFALQPVVLIAFVVLMMTSFDQLIFTDCCWEKSQDSAFWNLVVNAIDGTHCSTSPGYLLFFTNNSANSTMHSLFAYNVFNPAIITPLFYIVIFCFVFYHMAQSIHEFAAELVGGPTIKNFTLKIPNIGKKKKKPEDTTTAAGAPTRAAPAGGANKSAGGALEGRSGADDLKKTAAGALEGKSPVSSNL